MNYFQTNVGVWLNQVFEQKIADNPRQRMQRFLEEALEWFQAEDMTKQDAIALVDYVYSRPKGEPTQEIGGVIVTAAAACSRMGYSMELCANDELERICQPEIIEKIRRKQNAKNNELGISDVSPLTQRNTQ